MSRRKIEWLHITKPFSATYLKARIHNLVEQRKRLQQIYCQTLFSPKSEKKSVKEENMPVLSASDQKFMDKLIQTITENMDNCDFSVDNMALSVDMSRSNFFRKLKGITGQSPIDFLTYIIHSGFISGYQNRYGDNLKPPTNVYHRMTA